MGDTYNYDLLRHITCRFYLIDFINTALPVLHFFTVKLPSVIQRSVSQENAFKKSKN